MPAPIRAVAVARVLEAESAQAQSAVVDPVAVEMDDMVGGARIVGAFELRAQRREGRRLQEAQIDQTAQVFHGLDQRQAARAVVDIAAGVVLRPGDDQQEADGCGVAGLRVRRLAAGQAAADPGGAGALEQESLAVVQQFPGEREQGAGASRPGVLGGGTPPLLWVQMD
jgi:hypothetical protein|nr:hypothetical protein [Lamprocystis purpurea]